MIVGGVFWIVHMLIHILFTDRYVAHLATMVESPFVCSIDAPDTLEEGASEEESAAYDEAYATWEGECAAEAEAAAAEAEAAEAAEAEAAEAEGEGEDGAGDAAEGENW